MQKFDVLIVGGGPAGSTCARKLRAAGLDVAILDKAAFPRDKTCAGWITPEVVTTLELDTVEYARSRVLQPVTGFRTGLIGGRTVDTHYGTPVSFGIRRCEFDEYLLRRCGATLRLGEKLESLERSGDGWVVNGSITAPMVIGAGGHWCPVARVLAGAASSGKAAAMSKERIVAAQEIEFLMSPAQQGACAVRAEMPELYFCPDLQGYAWCFRKGNFLNVGEGREDDKQIAAHVAAFADLMKRQQRIPLDAPMKFHGHAYILYGHTARPLVDDGVVLIGDAAGLAYEQSGEGIRPAVESALMAARVVLAAQKDYRRDRLDAYARVITERFGPRAQRPSSLALPGAIPAALKEKVAAFLMTTKWFSRHVLIDRWFRHAQQPAMT
ncbi:MAG: NAD(P)/FAD-dependent oxidoreductase [Phycisphaerae bacterium]|mgnify:CR=1 FL=1|nr:NAD(P)/FAD-dependent oxidoreductase [Phycisphaerae bacterium]